MLGWVWHCLKCVRVLLHSLISFFLSLGRIVKHEKCLFTVQDHPVKHMSSLPLSPFNQPRVHCVYAQASSTTPSRGELEEKPESLKKLKHNILWDSA